MKNCAYCGCKLVQRKEQGNKRFLSQRFCSHSCAQKSKVQDVTTRLHKHIAIDPNTGCWNWTGSVAREYGQFRLNGKTIAPHRVTYWLKTGRMSTRISELHHTCENKLCCNPNHLELLSRAEHQQRSHRTLNYRNQRKTHCVHGHEFTLENTKIEEWRGRKRRRCRTCEKTRNR